MIALAWPFVALVAIGCVAFFAWRVTRVSQAVDSITTLRSRIGATQGDVTALRAAVGLRLDNLETRTGNLTDTVRDVAVSAAQINKRLETADLRKLGKL